MKKIVLTGGGTAGHVTPNIALIPALKEAGYEIWDRLVGMNNTYNLFHLDNYEDADIDDYVEKIRSKLKQLLKNCDEIKLN